VTATMTRKQNPDKRLQPRKASKRTQYQRVHNELSSASATSKKQEGSGEASQKRR
jgi:hypothetical protein